MMSFAWRLSLMVGFLSLSQEILWVRLVSFDYGGMPYAFSLVLTCYLFGIAIGANIGKYFCRKAIDLYMVAAVTLLLAGITDILTPILAPKILGRSFSTFLLTALAITMTAGIKSVLFPIAHHLGSSQQGPNVGRSVSKIYFGNIIGSTLGPIVTGFFLLNQFTVEQCFDIVGTVTLALSILSAAYCSSKQKLVTIITAVLIVLWILKPWDSPNAIHSLANHGDEKTHPVLEIIQNKQSIIHTIKNSETGDVVFGMNEYDGRINTSMAINSNMLERAYVLAAVHPKPSRILVIGMSAGAWTRVFQGFPGVEHIDLVEINPGYLQLVSKHPEVAPVLSDPRIHIHIDDGRRWLRRHPNEKYDLIVMNTTFHWRAYITNLLSREFFQELRRHLSKSGIVAINSTYSMDVLVTLKTVFPYVFQYKNFAYGSDHDIRVDADTAISRLRQCRMGGSAAFSPEQFEKNGLALSIATESLVPIETVLAEKKYTFEPEIITDENMLPEYRHGRISKTRALEWLFPSRSPKNKPDGADSSHGTS